MRWRKVKQKINFTHVSKYMVFFKPPCKTQGFTEGKSSVVILTNLCFHGHKMFSESTPVSLFQHGKNLARCSCPPEREIQMLARTLNILASTANHFHLLLTASKLTSDLGKRKKGIEGKRHRVMVVVAIFFFLIQQTKRAYNYMKHNFLNIILAINSSKLFSCLPFHNSIKYQANIKM